MISIELWLGMTPKHVRKIHSSKFFDVDKMSKSYLYFCCCCCCVFFISFGGGLILLLHSIEILVVAFFVSCYIQAKHLAPMWRLKITHLAWPTVDRHFFGSIFLCTMSPMTDLSVFANRGLCHLHMSQLHPPINSTIMAIDNFFLLIKKKSKIDLKLNWIS